MADYTGTAHQLRSFIAPAAPATRAPCDGSEPDMRIEFGFTPRWYREACGIDFSERWHLDPLYRHETIITMRKELNRRFPALRLGGPGPDAAPATIDGVHGALVISQIFGLPGDYYPDNWPAAQHAYLDETRIAKLEPPDLPNVPVIAQILEQMDAIERACGRIEGYLNWQGVLNNAFRIRGPEIFSDLMMNPDLARHLFEVIAHTMIAGMRLVYARQAVTGFIVRHATMSNCVVNMISPELYREHVFPWDRFISEAFDHFGIHNCAWNVDPYIADYARIEKLGYVDMGIMSDLVQAKLLCPHARRAIMYTPVDLVNKSLDELRADLENIRLNLSPCDIVMADIDAGTDDARVLAFARLAEETLAVQPRHSRNA